MCRFLKRNYSKLGFCSQNEIDELINHLPDYTERHVQTSGQLTVYFEKSTNKLTLSLSTRKIAVTHIEKRVGIIWLIKQILTCIELVKKERLFT